MSVVGFLLQYPIRKHDFNRDLEAWLLQFDYFKPLKEVYQECPSAKWMLSIHDVCMVEGIIKSVSWSFHLPLGTTREWAMLENMPDELRNDFLEFEERKKTVPAFILSMYPVPPHWLEKKFMDYMDKKTAEWMHENAPNPFA